MGTTGYPPPRRRSDPPAGGRRFIDASDPLPPLGGRSHRDAQLERYARANRALEKMTGQASEFFRDLQASMDRHFGVHVEPVLRAYAAEVEDVDTASRTITCRVGSECLDRYNTVIAPHGIEVADFVRTGSPVLWEHGRDMVNRGAMPIGNAVAIDHVVGPTGPELVAQVRFFDDDEFCDKLFKRYRKRQMSAWSVNVIPHADSCSPPTRSEIAARPELATCAMMYRRSSLAEFSAVSCPGNPDATTIDHRRSIIVL